MWFGERGHFVLCRGRCCRRLGVCLRPSMCRRLFQASMFDFSARNLKIDKTGPGKLTNLLKICSSITPGIPIWVTLQRQPSVRLDDFLRRSSLHHFEDLVIVHCNWDWRHAFANVFSRGFLFSVRLQEESNLPYQGA